jgi:hypothetical protein
MSAPDARPTLLEVGSATPIATPEVFLARRPAEERLVNLVAFALAAEAKDPPTDDTLAARRREADKLLTENAFRTLHNQLAEIRREAVAEHMAALRPPLGFWGVAAACGAALLVFGLGTLWLVAHPGSLAALTSMMGG